MRHRLLFLFFYAAISCARLWSMDNQLLISPEVSSEDGDYFGDEVVVEKVLPDELYQKNLPLKKRPLQPYNASILSTPNENSPGLKTCYSLIDRFNTIVEEYNRVIKELYECLPDGWKPKNEIEKIVPNVETTTNFLLQEKTNLESELNLLKQYLLILKKKNHGKNFFD